MLKLQIDDIDSLPFPVYVLVAGGIGVGKTHVVRKNIRDIQVMDLDDVMEELGHRKYDSRNTSEAMNIITERVEAVLERCESMVAMGTSANLPFSIDRLYGAKNRGYKTVLLHVDASIEQAVYQNELRREKGQRAVGPEESYKIHRTNQGAANTVATLKDTDLVDYFIHHINNPD